MSNAIFHCWCGCHPALEKCGECCVKPKPPMIIPIPRLTPRHVWFFERSKACLDLLYDLYAKEDWDAYKIEARELCEELSYAVNEWDKYYKESQ